MKKLALLSIMILLASAAVFTFGRSQAAAVSDDPVKYISGCDGPKQEQTSNGVQVRLEICGSDHDGYDIDAANPDTGEKWDCSYRFTLTGTKKGKDESVSISRDKTITVSSTAKGWFNAFGESGLEGKNLKISSFSVSCSK